MINTKIKTTDIETVTNHIAEYYGLDHQYSKLQEECAELIRAIARGDEENITEELADVTVMLNQIIHLMDNEKAVKLIMTNKLYRTLEIIGRDNANSCLECMERELQSDGVFDDRVCKSYDCEDNHAGACHDITIKHVENCPYGEGYKTRKPW